MDDLNRWFNEAAATPTGSVLLFLIVALVRLAVNRQLWKRRRKPSRKNPKPAGGSA